MSIITKVIGDKRAWRDYKARVGALPQPHRTAVDSIERYLLRTGPTDGARLMTMLDDLADLFERGAADGSTVGAVVGDDPVGFADEFKRNYGLGSWLESEQRQLTDAVSQARRD